MHILKTFWISLTKNNKKETVDGIYKVACWLIGVYTINLCVYTPIGLVPSRFSLFVWFNTERSRDKHVQRGKNEAWERGKNLYLQNKSIFLGTSVFECFLFNLLEVPSCQRAPVLAEWWLPDPSVPAEHLPSPVTLGNVRPICLHFFSLSIFLKESVKGLHLHWFYLSEWFSLSYYHPFSQ